MSVASATNVKKKPPRRMVGFSDPNGVIRDYLKKFVGSSPNGNVSAIGEGSLNEMLGGNIGLNRVIYLALHELEISINNGRMNKDEVINILKDSGLGLF